MRESYHSEVRPVRSVKNALERKKWPTIGPSIGG
jgi:hypothetical protein